MKSKTVKSRNKKNKKNKTKKSKKIMSKIKKTTTELKTTDACSINSDFLDIPVIQNRFF